MSVEIWRPKTSLCSAELCDDTLRNEGMVHSLCQDQKPETCLKFWLDTGPAVGEEWHVPGVSLKCWKKIAYVTQSNSLTSRCNLTVLHKFNFPIKLDNSSSNFSRINGSSQCNRKYLEISARSCRAQLWPLPQVNAISLSSTLMWDAVFTWHDVCFTGSLASRPHVHFDRTLPTVHFFRNFTHEWSHTSSNDSHIFVGVR
jgi:hypothetical protein